MDKILIQRGQDQIPRRWFLALGGAGLLGAYGWSKEVQGEETIVQPVGADDQGFIARAFEMRQLAIEKGDQPYGAVVVLDGRIVGQSWSRVLLDHDPTGHAEMAAIRDAGRRLQRSSLSGAVLYFSSRPCPMCEAAAAWAGIDDMVYGRAAERAGRPHLCG
ncbi:nucleoside deaminase [Motiliproteus sp.]|uniref:nucleoside deaminase n=1 Tax=Motiliproteus sp. TaxID=1898955 RepID=UPI003BA986C9